MQSATIAHGAADRGQYGASRLGPASTPSGQLHESGVLSDYPQYESGVLCDYPQYESGVLSDYPSTRTSQVLARGHAILARTANPAVNEPSERIPTAGPLKNTQPSVYSVDTREIVPGTQPRGPVSPRSGSRVVTSHTAAPQHVPLRSAPPLHVRNTAAPQQVPLRTAPPLPVRKVPLVKADLSDAPQAAASLATPPVLPASVGSSRSAKILNHEVVQPGMDISDRRITQSISAIIHNEKVLSEQRVERSLETNLDRLDSSEGGVEQPVSATNVNHRILPASVDSRRVEDTPSLENRDIPSSDSPERRVGATVHPGILPASSDSRMVDQTPTILGAVVDYKVLPASVDLREERVQQSASTAVSSPHVQPEQDAPSDIQPPASSSPTLSIQTCTAVIEGLQLHDTAATAPLPPPPGAPDSDAGKEAVAEDDATKGDAVAPLHRVKAKAAPPMQRAAPVLPPREHAPTHVAMNTPAWAHAAPNAVSDDRLEHGQMKQPASESRMRVTRAPSSGAHPESFLSQLYLAGLRQTPDVDPAPKQHAPHSSPPALPHHASPPHTPSTFAQKAFFGARQPGTPPQVTAQPPLPASSNSAAHPHSALPRSSPTLLINAARDPAPRSPEPYAPPPLHMSLSAATWDQAKAQAHGDDDDDLDEIVVEDSSEDDENLGPEWSDMHPSVPFTAPWSEQNEDVLANHMTESDMLLSLTAGAPPGPVLAGSVVQDNTNGSPGHLLSGVEITDETLSSLLEPPPGGGPGLETRQTSSGSGSGAWAGIPEAASSSQARPKQPTSAALPSPASAVAKALEEQARPRSLPLASDKPRPGSGWSELGSGDPTPPASGAEQAVPVVRRRSKEEDAIAERRRSYESSTKVQREVVRQVPVVNKEDLGWGKVDGSKLYRF